MILAHKIAFDPNNVQATYLAKAAGTARFAYNYNWALAEWKRQYEVWKQDDSRPKPSAAALRRQLNSIKREQFPWMLEVTKRAPQMAIIQLRDAFKNFFASSKTCSVCGYQLEALPLSAREWTRPAWGVLHDRDLKAARSILAYGLTVLNGPAASSAGSHACGEEGAGRSRGCGETSLGGAGSKPQIWRVMDLFA